MKKNIFIILSTSILLFTHYSFPTAEAKHKHHGGVCRPSGKLKGKKPPPHKFNKENDSECCVEGKTYMAYHFSPPVSRKRSTKALLTLNGFEKGKDGGGPSECDNKFHSDNKRIVALSTGWSTRSGDECASAEVCNATHDYQSPCPNNVVDASKAVWKDLGVPSMDWGSLKGTWSDA
ncbi:unnamed protein product [Linum trigynum]|uniref:Ripening-related protein 1 n=1 Tax=Linum trigynum TaxID=586398 RepID=A0AAV2DYE6_9ROSI